MKDQEAPPFGKSWNRLYAFVLLHLLFLIVLFSAFTKFFD